MLAMNKLISMIKQVSFSLFLNWENVRVESRMSVGSDTSEFQVASPDERKLRGPNRTVLVLGT